MKNLKIAVIALFTVALVGSVNAQEESNEWTIGFGVSSIDMRGSSDFGDVFKDYIGTSDWSTMSSVSRISVEKYLRDGITLQAVGSINKLDKANGEVYLGFDVNAKYDVNKLIDYAFGSTTKWFDPFVYMGAGYTSFDNVGEVTMNIGLGFNAWFTDSVGLNFQSGAKRQFSDKIGDHFQHSLGIVIKLGGKEAK